LPIKIGRTYTAAWQQFWADAILLAPTTHGYQQQLNPGLLVANLNLRATDTLDKKINWQVSMILT